MTAYVMSLTVITSVTWACGPPIRMKNLHMFFDGAKRGICLSLLLAGTFLSQHLMAPMEIEHVVRPSYAGRLSIWRISFVETSNHREIWNKSIWIREQTKPRHLSPSITRPR